MQAAEKLFRDNVNYNRMLAKQRAKCRCRAEGHLSPDRVVALLKGRGVTVSRRTLLNWEVVGMIPEARRGGHGQGRGRWTSYPDGVVVEAIAASILKEVYSWRHAEIAEARRAYYEGLVGQHVTLYGSVLTGARLCE